MKGAPYVSCIKRVAAAGNDQAALMMVKGDVDWTGNFIANVQKVYASKDPAHYHFFYAKNADPVGLFGDDTKYPWSLKPLRQAVSMGVDRAAMVKIGSYGYAPPSKSLGIEFEFPKWIDSKAEAAGKKYVTYNPSAAKALLTKSGFTYKGSDLYDPKGNRVSMELNVIAGWTDWVLDMQVLQKQLQALGIDTSLKLVPTQGDWENKVNKGLGFHFHWTCPGVIDPFGYFREHLSGQTFVPSGQMADNPTPPLKGGCN
jgi:peptide/nickel transport system substrate-binding protein